MTDEPTTDVFAGFLPPNDETGRGDGSVSFTINLKDGLPEDAEVTNRAEIIFDYNEPIMTPAWTNRKDILPPVSKMLQPIEQNDGKILLQWNGTDNASGIWYYDVYVRTGENGSWTLLCEKIQLLETDFEYLPDVEYSFYVVATDNANNMEEKAVLPEVSFSKGDTGVNEMSVHQLQIFPNPAKNNITVKTDLQIEKVEIADLSGRIVELWYAASLQTGSATLNISALPQGVYLLKVYTNEGLAIRKIVKE